jgi:hypothetical protein
MNTKIKKSMKLITLLITTLCIAIASAQVYSYMYINGSASITTGGLEWQKGTSAPAGATVVGYNVNNLNLTIQENNFKNFTDCLRIVNNDATTAHTFDLSTTVTSGDPSKFTTFDLIVYQTDGTRLATLSVKTGGSASDVPIAGGETVYIRFEVDPVTDATSGYLAFTTTLTYEL